MSGYTDPSFHSMARSDPETAIGLVSYERGTPVADGEESGSGAVCALQSVR